MQNLEINASAVLDIAAEKQALIAKLESKILATESYGYETVTPEYIGFWLFGVNRGYANDPFSLEFMHQVQYCSNEAMPGVLYLQVCKKLGLY